MEEEYKSCPYCGCEINAKAIKCRYCKEWLTEEMREAHKSDNIPPQINVEDSQPSIEMPAHPLSSEELDDRLMVILNDEDTIKDKDDRIKAAALLYQKHRGGSYAYAKKHLETLEEEKSDEKIDKWFDNYGGCLVWIIALVVLFFTNPKSVEKHKDNVLEHYDNLATEMQVYLKQSLLNNGVEAYYIEGVFKDVVSNYRKRIDNEVEVYSLGVLSLGRAGHIRTLGILGMVFNISWLFDGDSACSNDVVNELLDRVNDDLRIYNTLVQLFS